MINISKVYFKYGTVNSGKSLDLLKTAYNFIKQDKKILIFTSNKDNREGVGKVNSRIGIEQQAEVIEDKTNIKMLIDAQRPDIVLCDECQLYEDQNIIDLISGCHLNNIPIIFYGLKSNFKGVLFSSSQILLTMADKIEEIKTICWFCNRKAMLNLKIKDGEPMFEGKEIEIGGIEKYLPVCRHHFIYPPKEKISKESEENETNN